MFFILLMFLNVTVTNRSWSISEKFQIMTEYEDIMANIADDDSDSSDNDTDEELKEAFAAGIIKPGLNYMGEAPEKKVVKNNIPAMKQKIAEFKKNLPWVC